MVAAFNNSHGNTKAINHPSKGRSSWAEMRVPFGKMWFCNYDILTVAQYSQLSNTKKKNRSWPSFLSELNVISKGQMFVCFFYRKLSSFRFFSYVYNLLLEVSLAAFRKQTSSSVTAQVTTLTGKPENDPICTIASIPSSSLLYSDLLRCYSVASPPSFCMSHHSSWFFLSQCTYAGGVIALGHRGHE